LILSVSSNLDSDSSPEQNKTISMLDASIISLIALGGAALFGLQGSISLAVRHHLVRELNSGLPATELHIPKKQILQIFL
jgi:hypothetical protein